MAYNGGLSDDPTQNFFSVRYTASPYRKSNNSKFPANNPLLPPSYQNHINSTTNTGVGTSYTQNHHQQPNTYVNGFEGPPGSTMIGNHWNSTSLPQTSINNTNSATSITGLNEGGNFTTNNNGLIQSQNLLPTASTTSAKYNFSHQNHQQMHLGNGHGVGSCTTNTNNTSTNTMGSYNPYYLQQHHQQQVLIQQQLSAQNQNHQLNHYYPTPSSISTSVDHYGLPQLPHHSQNIHNQQQIFVQNNARFGINNLFFNGSGDINKNSQVNHMSGYQHGLDEGYIEELAQEPAGLKMQMSHHHQQNHQIIQNQKIQMMGNGHSNSDSSNKIRLLHMNSTRPNDSYEPYNYVYDSKIQELTQFHHHQHILQQQQDNVGHLNGHLNSDNIQHMMGKLPEQPSRSTSSLNRCGSSTTVTENEYEEIKDVQRYLNLNKNQDEIDEIDATSIRGPPPPRHFKSFSSTDDLIAEVVQVQERHDRVLDQLNLEVENLLIHSSNELELQRDRDEFGLDISNSKLSISNPSGLNLNHPCYCNIIPQVPCPLPSPSSGGLMKNGTSSSIANGGGGIYNFYGPTKGPGGQSLDSCCCLSENDLSLTNISLNLRRRSNHNTSLSTRALNTGTSCKDKETTSGLNLRFGSTGRKKKFDKNNQKLQGLHASSEKLLETNSNSNSNSNAGNSNSTSTSSSSKIRHHRTHSLIPHWKIKEHLMRLPFLRQHQDKLKKGGELQGPTNNSNSNSKSASGQDFSTNTHFGHTALAFCRRNSASYNMTTALPSSKTRSSPPPSTHKNRSSSMDELNLNSTSRTTAPVADAENWYSADSDTEPDSLGPVQNISTSVITLDLQNQNQNKANSCTENGSTTTTTNSTTASVQSHIPSTNTNTNTIPHSLPEAPRAPKFRRAGGSASSGVGIKDKWRESWASSKTLTKTTSMDEENRLLRWFSLRKNQGHVDHSTGGGLGGGNCVQSGTGNNRHTTHLSNLNEEESMKRSSFIEDEEGYWPRRTVVPPSLPPAPADLTSEQITRRHIVAAIVHSENNYVAALQRLVNEYKKPLEVSHPAILSHSKISAVFHRVPEILQCHSLFRIALAECVRRWDTDEKIGDVFVASFSKSLVLDVYSEFINNFGNAMETAKLEARRKSAFADFLKVKQMTAHDRLSLFGLMVKPVQRFPQFILLLQDLLKHTPKEHHDRMSLQLALTQLESLAAMLNERKRESEQYQAFRETIKMIGGGKFVLIRSVADDPNRILLRQDIMTQLEFDLHSGGTVAKSKTRKLLLLNDMLICVSLNSTQQQQYNNQQQQQQGKQQPQYSEGTGKVEKSVFKWSYNVRDVEVEDISISPTMSRFVHQKTGSLKNNSNPHIVDDESSTSITLLEEMQALMYDYEVLSRILSLVSTLKSPYENLSVQSVKELMLEIQHQIRCRDEQISYFDSSCLTLILGSGNNREKIVFQMDSPSSRNDWIEELKLAQLALDPNNSPAWDIPTESPYVHHKLPLFVRALSLNKLPHLTTVKCGVFFTHTFVSPTGRSKILDYLWVNSTDGISSHVTAYKAHQNNLKEVSSFDLVEEKINDLLFVLGYVWVATESRKIQVYDPADPEKGSINSYIFSDSVLKLHLFERSIYAGLADGNLAIFSNIKDSLNLAPDYIIKLGNDRIPCLFGQKDHIYAACGNAIVSVDTATYTIEKNVSLTNHTGPITHMVCSGVGLWITTKDSGTVCLYHLESFQHLQDVSIAPSVFRTIRDSFRRQKGCYVTCLQAHKGWLWIGTNLGVVCSIPLPRLEGVPIISTGKANVSYHGFCGPVTFLMPLVKTQLSSLQPPKIHLQTPNIKQTSKQTSDENRNDIIIHETEEDLVRSPQLSASNSSCSTSSKDNSDPIVKVKNRITFDGCDSSVKSESKSDSLSSLSNNSSLALDSPPSGLSPTSTINTNNGSSKKKGASPSPSSGKINSNPEISSITSKTLEKVILRKKNSRDNMTSLRNCKTLPRGGTHHSLSSRFSIDSDVYGLYGNLINVRGLEDEGRFVDPLYDALRRSDPELNALDAKISTLDRRLKMRMSRPRSLDLSNWSVDSKISASSDESGGSGLIHNGSASSGSGRNLNTNSPSINTNGSSGVIDVLNEPLNNNNSNSAGISESCKSHTDSTEQKQQVTTTPARKQTLKRSKTISKPKNPADRTVIVIIGGRGYVNMRSQNQSNLIQEHFIANDANNSDSKICAHLTVWQMKT